MGTRLLPLTVGELCAHALVLEREATLRFGEYAARMVELGDRQTAEFFNDLRQEAYEEVRALEVAAQGKPPASVSAWEYAWRMNWAPGTLEPAPRLLPLSSREALQLALLAKRRAEAFYGDVAANARETGLRSCAAEMAARRHGQIDVIEQLLAETPLEGETYLPRLSG